MCNVRSKKSTVPTTTYFRDNDWTFVSWECQELVHWFNPMADVIASKKGRCTQQVAGYIIVFLFLMHLDTNECAVSSKVIWGQD